VVCAQNTLKYEQYALCLPVALSERVRMSVCVREPDKGNMPYLKITIIYQKNK
jgi:hypothetical protein